MPKFNKGDWCFCEFKLQQVQEIEDDRITRVSDGHFTMSGRDLSDVCYPLNMRIKLISDTVAYWSAEFHNLKYYKLNHPDLNRELIKRWIEMCECTQNNDLETLYENLNNFVLKVIDKVKKSDFSEVECIELIRQ